MHVCIFWKSFDTDSKSDVPVGQTLHDCKSLVELKSDVTTILFDSGPYQREKGHQVVQYLLKILTEYSHNRKDIADFLADLEYAKTIIDHMRQITILDAIESDRALTLTAHALMLCLNLSGVSSSFAKCLAKGGAVELLTLVIVDEEYLRNGEIMEAIYSLLRNTVDILNNIARHVPTKQCFVENNTANALKNLLNWNKRSLEVRALLTLALVLDEDELLHLTDDTDVIKTIVRWINLACCNQDRTHEGFSPSELAEGLTKLATNHFNKSKIIMRGGLIALTKMLSHNDPMEKITSAECVKTIALDAALRLNILHIRDLTKALLSFRYSQHKHVFCQGLSTLVVLCDKSQEQARIKEKTLQQKRTQRQQEILKPIENMVMPQPVTAMPSDNLTPTQLCSSVYPPDTLVLQQQQMQYNHPDILRHNLNNSIDQCVTLLQENSSMLFCSEDTMTKTAWHPPVKLLDQCDGLNHQTVCQGQHQTDLKQLDHCTEPLLQINVASKQSETLLVSPLQMNTPLLHMNNNVLPQLQNNEPNQCLDSNVYPQQFSEHLVPVSSVTPHSLSILPSQQNASVPQSNTNYQHDIDAIFASSETISISENEVPEIQDDSSEDIINAHFLVDYMTFRGKIDADDPDFKQLLEISNQRDRNEALLNHVLHSECEALDEALAHYHVYSEQFQDIITGVLSLESTLNIQRDQAYSSLTWEQVEGLVSSLFCKFLTDPTENSSNEVAFGYQYSLYVIGRMFSTEIVEKIGDYLSELEYARLAVSILRKIKPHQVFERSNELALSGITLCICIIYSGVSRLFALSLAHNGMVDTLTAHITESCIINNLTEKYMENMMTDFLRLIKNMAYHCEDKQHFKDSKTSEHVKRLPIRNNENVEIIVILILLNTLDEKEFNKLPDETKAIESMIKYMHRAIENKDTRSFHGISLCELTNGISKLALKFHKINMTHKVEVLSALCKMLHHTDPKEHISSSICLRALMSEADIRMKLKEFPQILSAMEGLMRNSSISVRKYVEEALKPIHFCMSDDTGEEKEKRVLFHNTEFSEGPISVDVQASGVANAVVCPTAYHHQKCVNPELKMLLQNQDLLTPETGLSHITQVPLITNYFVNVQYNKIKNAVKQEEKFTAKGKSEKIKPEDEDKVLKNWEYLLEELDATHIVDSMFAKKIFDLNDKREIIEPASRQKRTEILLKKLLNAGPGPAFETFITVLEADHSHIAKKLTETL